MEGVWSDCAGVSTRSVSPIQSVRAGEREVTLQSLGVIPPMIRPFHNAAIKTGCAVASDPMFMSSWVTVLFPLLRKSISALLMLK